MQYFNNVKLNNKNCLEIKSFNATSIDKFT